MLNYTTSSVAILLATYNAVDYLPQLLASLQNQSYTDWHLFVQDDLSTDGTVEMVKRYAASDARIELVDNREKLGAMRNFLGLLDKVEAPYYMFCDHDDVWLPNKVELTLERMRGAEAQYPEVPVVVHTDLKVVDADLQEIHPSFWRMSRISPALLTNFAELGGHYLTTGCTMMLNAAAKRVAFPVSSAALMHDSWVTICVMQHHGVVVGVDVPTILYRQHGNNTIGARDVEHHYIQNKLRSLGAVWHANRDYYHMLRAMGYGNILKFIYYKLRYFVLYKK